jgi:ribosomal protein S18 acetylase RimI-like enzyme
VSAVIRPYQPGDLAALYDICVLTGDDGQDATGKFKQARLLADIYLGPYVFLEPGLAFVLDDGGRPVGYVVGTADTAAFVQSYRDEWLPRLAVDYPEPLSAPVTPDEELRAVAYQPERMLRPELSDYPAHLHIDVLPSHQGGGHGRRLIETFIAAAARSGAGGTHLAVSPTNVRAHGFYLRVGFERLEVARAGGAIYYGRKSPGAQEFAPRVRGGTT